MSKKKAIVAMSGGVDSSVAAALLVQAGYDVTGVMLKLWKGEEQNNNSGCCNLGAADDARRVADVLGIPFYVFNFADRFQETVVSDFKSTYAAGRTPNPCIRCNQWIKFDALLERAKSLGAEVLATGHYARVDRKGERYRLLRGMDRDKDQSYVLWMLRQEDLAVCRFPVGEMEKSDTRALAAELGLRTARKPDSQEICFVRDGDLGGYLSSELPEADTPGPIRDRTGRLLGEHGGFARYTIGQRKGLGISVGAPVFVTEIDPASNTVVVGDRSALHVGEISLSEVSFVADTAESDQPVLVQYRAHGDTVRGRLTKKPSGWTVGFEGEAEAVAPGQSAVFYSPADPHEVLGGGIVEATRPAFVTA